MTCTGCGAPADPTCPQPQSCDQCPPSTCDECGGVNHIATDRMCSCWISLEGLPFADVKGLLASGGLSVETPA